MWKGAIALAGLVIACSGDAPEAPPPAVSGSDAGNVEQAASQIVATCAETVGTIEVRRQGQVRWEKVVVGTTLRERDWVRSGTNSFARLRFGARGFLDLAEGTTVLIDKAITVDAGTVVGIAQGEDHLTVRAKDGSEARIQSTGDRAEFRITPSASGVEIAVTKGNVKVVTSGRERVVAAGEATDLVNRATGEIVKLLGYPTSAAPGVDARFSFVGNMKIPLSWKTVPGAASYLVQVARDTEFHDLVLTASPKEPKTSFPPDVEGLYVWRVAARDQAGRVGEFGFARRFYCESGEPIELLVAPRDGFKVDFPNKPPAVEFSWRPVGEAKSYKLVIQRGAPGSEPPITKQTSAQRISVTLDEGTYTWGVYTVGSRDEVPIFLSLRQLVITKQKGPTIRTEVQWKTP